jgi:hypothetical protein
VLIGEGRDEDNFFKALTAHLGLTDVQVEEYGGKGNLSKYLREFGVRPGRQNVVALGITRDADVSPAQVYQSICTLLGNNGCRLPLPPVKLLQARRVSASLSCPIINEPACLRTCVWMLSRRMVPRRA